MADRGARPTARGGGSLALGIVLIVLGVLFLASQVLDASFWTNLWPVAIVAIGLAFFVGMVLGGKSAAALAVPGSILTVLGLMLWYQSAFEQWQTWSYSWALIVVAAGVGLMIQGFWGELPKPFQAGLRVAGLGVLLFVTFGAFFELVLRISGVDTFGRWLWPLALLAIGVYLIVRRGGRRV